LQLGQLSEHANLMRLAQPVSQTESGTSPQIGFDTSRDSSPSGPERFVQIVKAELVSLAIKPASTS
jgi:hypothetical protein